MSWSIQCIGSPEKVIETLEAKSEQISTHPEDASRSEYDAAKPHIIALVKQNFVADDAKGYSKPCVMVNASGSASSTLRDEKRHVLSSSCSVEVKTFYGFVG